MRDLERYPNYPMGRHLCGLYYDYTGEGAVAQQELGEAVKRGAVGQLGITYAAVLFREGKCEEAFKVLESLSDDRNALVTLGLFYAVNESTRNAAVHTLAKMDSTSASPPCWRQPRCRSPRQRRYGCFAATRIRQGNWRENDFSTSHSIVGGRNCDSRSSWNRPMLSNC